MVLGAVPLLSAAVWVAGMLHAQSITANLDDPTSVAFFIDGYRFPRSTGTIFTTGPWLNFAALYLAAVTAGSEFSWGTVRNAVFAPRGRVSYALAHFAFLSLLIAGMILAVLALGILLPIAAVAGAAISDPGTFDGITAGSELIFTFTGAAVWAAAGVALATLLRNPVTPILVAVSYSVFEAFASPLAIWKQSEVTRWIPRLLPGNSVGGLAVEVQRHAGTVGEGAQLPDYLGSPWTVSLVAAMLWVLVFVAVSVLVLRSVDIGE